jgi:low temperature requirement protein LtrA
MAASDARAIVGAVGGPMLFLVGTILFKHAIPDWLQLSHGVGIIALGALGWFGTGLSPLMHSIAARLATVIVAVWESPSLRSGAGPLREDGAQEAPSVATSA